MTEGVIIDASLDRNKIIHHYLSIEGRKINLEQHKITYDLIEIIGEGGFGVVHLCLSNFSPKLLAIKITDKKIKTNQEEITNYTKLVKNTNYTKYIPKLYHIFEDNSTYYIVMEFINGNHFSGKMFDEKIHTVDNFIKLVKKVLKIIEFIHKNDLVINDVKPENILVDINLKPKMIDFGLMSDENDIDECLKGTLIYFPPESFKYISTYKKKDMWMFACIVINLITKKCPMSECIHESGFFYKFDTHHFNKVVHNIKKKFLSETQKKFGTSDNTIKKLNKLWHILHRCIELKSWKRPSVKHVLKNKLFNVI